MSKVKKPKETISFRLPPTFMRQLAAVSDARKARSPDDLARQFVIDALADQDVRPELEAMQEQFSMLREDLVTAIAYMLQSTAKLDAKEARKTAEQIFRKETPRE
jgi:hypothetical protein